MTLCVDLARMQRLITWTADAAREHVALARYGGETPDPEPGMGLWQSFQAAFPILVGYERDLLVSVWGAVYRETVKALVAIEETGLEKGETRVVIELGVTGDADAIDNAMERLLDGGAVQDLVNDWECDEGPLEVTSARARVVA